MRATAVATSFQSQDPQFLKTDPQFLKSAETPEKQPILGGKKLFWSLKKIFQSVNGCAMSFLQKIEEEKNPSNLASAAAQTFYTRVSGA